MEGLVNATDKKEVEQEFSFKRLFVPFSSLKAIHLIIIVGLIVFINVLFNGFVLDDRSYIIENPEVHTINISYLFGQNVFNNAGQYRPLVAIYFATLYTIFGANPFFFHLIQIFLHISISIFIFFLFKKFFSPIYSLLFALIFLVHPIQVESVSYIGASASELFFLFGLLALFISLQKNRYKDIFVFIFLLLALLVKESAIGFLILLPIFHVVLKKAYRYKREVIISLVALAVYLVIRFAVGGIFFSARTMIPITRLTFTERLLNIPAIFLYYIKTFFFPAQLAVDQLWTITSTTVQNFYIPLLYSLLFLGIIGYLGVWIYKKHKKDFVIYAFFLLWFLLGIGIILQLVPLDMTVADRWFYFPIVGLLGMTGVFLKNFELHKKNLTNITVAILIFIICVFSLRTIVRNFNWNNGVTLDNHDKQISDNFILENDLSVEYLERNQYQESLQAAYASASFFRNDLTLYTLGHVYENMGNIKQAEYYYSQALSAKDYVPWNHKHYVQLYSAYAQLLIFFDNQKKANDFIKLSLQDWSDSSQLWLLLAYSEYKLNNHTQAVLAAQKAYSLSNNPVVREIYQRLLANQDPNVVYTKQ